MKCYSIYYILYYHSRKWLNLLRLNSGKLAPQTQRYTADLCIDHTATHCNTLQHIATHCSTLQHTATHCNTLQHFYNTLHHAEHFTTFQNTLKLSATLCNTLQHIAPHCTTLRHTTTYCTTRCNTVTYEVASIRRLLQIIGLFCKRAL